MMNGGGLPNKLGGCEEREVVGFLFLGVPPFSSWETALEDLCVYVRVCACVCVVYCVLCACACAHACRICPRFLNRLILG